MTLTKTIILTTIFTLIVAATITIPQQQAQAKQITTISGLNYNTIQDAIDSQRILLNSAKLHNSTTEHIKQLGFGYDVLICVKDILTPPNTVNNINTVFPGIYRTYVGQCDNEVTDGIVNHSAGMNQTIINIARDYLRARGIQ